MIGVCENCGVGYAPDGNGAKICPRCSEESVAVEAALKRTTKRRRINLRDDFKDIEGDWSQLERGDCKRCFEKDVWLYSPVKYPNMIVCGQCAMALSNRGLPLDN